MISSNIKKMLITRNKNLVMHMIKKFKNKIIYVKNKLKILLNLRNILFF